MSNIAYLFSALLVLLRFYFCACSETCSSEADSSSDCEPRASRSLLQQERTKLQAIGLDTMSERKDDATLRQGASTKLLYRLFDSPKGARLGVDVSLLEIALAKHKAPLQHREAKALLHSISEEGSKSKRVDPKGMERHVMEELLPMAETTAAELQKEINNAMDAVSNCSTLLWNAENALSHRQKILDTDEGAEYGCLIHENQANHIKKEACDRVDKMINVLKESEPAKVSSLPNKSAANVLPVMKASKEFYMKAYSDFAAANARCTEATANASQIHKECVVDKEVVEKFYCYMKEGRDKACAEYDKCFGDARDNYKQVKGHVEKTEAINKEHFTQMACSIWVKDSSPHCELDNSALDVTYPEEPLKGTCVPMMKFHGRGDHTTFRCEQESIPTPVPVPEDGNATNESASLAEGVVEDAEAKEESEEFVDESVTSESSSEETSEDEE